LFLKKVEIFLLSKSYETQGGFLKRKTNKANLLIANDKSGVVRVMYCNETIKRICFESASESAAALISQSLKLKLGEAARTQAPTTTNYDVGSTTWVDLRLAPLQSAMKVTCLGHGPS